MNELVIIFFIKTNFKVMSLVFHPKKNILLSSSADETIICWDIPSGDILKILCKHNNWVILFSITLYFN